ncbi:unnamed protein product [Cunninghamella blakesleeana]
MILTSSNNNNNNSNSNNSNTNINNNNNDNDNLPIPLEQLSNTTFTTATATIIKNDNHHHILSDIKINPLTMKYADNINNNNQPTNNRDDIVTVSNRMKGDICYRLFGTALDKTVHQILYFTTLTNDQNILKIQAFVHQQTLFLMFSKETIDEVFSWSLSKFQSWFTYLIDITEQETGCIYMIVAINKQQNKADTILRTFYYIGFQLVKPSVYNHSSDYILVGYSLE